MYISSLSDVLLSVACLEMDVSGPHWKSSTWLLLNFVSDICSYWCTWLIKIYFPLHKRTAIY